MKKIQFILLLSVAFIVSVACETSSKSGEDVVTHPQEEIAEDISPAKFNSLISEKAIVLDVRTPNEFQSGHIKDAVNIDFFSEDFMNQVQQLDKSKVLLIHCASGGRSSKAMNKLKGKGFAALYNMLGGMNAWKNNGLPVEK